jgi:hypothetical protein
LIQMYISANQNALENVTATFTNKAYDSSTYNKPREIT